MNPNIAAVDAVLDRAAAIIEDLRRTVADLRPERNALRARVAELEAGPSAKPPPASAPANSR